ncbi:MAG: hypothetical protein AABW65_01255 [Nanoarchaeota archaeon]
MKPIIINGATKGFCAKTLAFAVKYTIRNQAVRELKAIAEYLKCFFAGVDFFIAMWMRSQVTKAKERAVIVIDVLKYSGIAAMVTLYF